MQVSDNQPLGLPSIQLCDPTCSELGALLRDVHVGVGIHIRQHALEREGACRMEQMAAMYMSSTNRAVLLLWAPNLSCQSNQCRFGNESSSNQHGSHAFTLQKTNAMLQGKQKCRTMCQQGNCNMLQAICHPHT